jgi:DNA-binding response OmpR family regulator
MASILVVDDEQMICDLLRSVFSSHGHEVLTATSGREGLDLFRQRRPRFTLLDLLMPEMDGLEVLKQIREMDPEAGVIMLTGGGTDALEARAREMGVTDFLRKGLPLEVLIKTIEKAIHQHAKLTAATPAATATGKAKPGAKSVLVVDDESQTCDLISQYLTTRGYRVRTAPDGPSALALVEQERPHFIILDMALPGMSGLELLRQLRAKQWQYKGGVLALTGKQDENVLQGMMELGAVDVMGKPVDLGRLELAVQLGCILTSS